MKRKALLSLAILTLQAIGLFAAKDFTQLGKETYGTSMSPSGRYVVGVGLKNRIYGLYSAGFIYDLQTKQLSWLTAFDANQYDKAGQFDDVNDDGVICGTSKDINQMITYQDVTAPLNVATIWKNGVATRLPYGELDRKQFKQLEDGTYATALSADGKTVVGYAAGSNFTLLTPCKWTETKDGRWQLSLLPLPKNGKNARANYISANGRIIVGTVQIDYNTYAIYWVDGVPRVVHAVGEDAASDDYADMRVLDMSPNGRYFTFSISSSMYFRIFDTQTGTYRKLPTFDVEGAVQTMPIDNNGNIAGVVTYGFYAFGDDAYNRPYYYQYATDRLFELPYVMGFFASGLQPDFSLSYLDKTQAIPFAISGDGNTIAGNKDIYVALGQTPQSWVLRMETRNMVFPATPSIASIFSENMKEVTLTWAIDKQKYDGFTLKKYNIYEDGKLKTQHTIKGTEKEQLVLKDVKAGFPTFTIEAVFEDKDGKEFLSPASMPATVSVPDTYALPFFDNFDTQSLQTHFWNPFVRIGSSIDAIWGTAPYYGYKRSPALVAGNNMNKPYENGIVSRPMDATKHKWVNLSFLIQCQLYAAPLGADTLAIEVSTDKGATWKSVRRFSIGDLPTQFMQYSFDISEYVAGQLFTLRLRKYGEGATAYYVYIDNFKLSTTITKAAPDGIMGFHDIQTATLLWKDASGTYPLNYIQGVNEEMLTLGNKGAELIGANKFTKAELEHFDGKYLTGVSTNINHYKDSKEEQGIHAAIVVFEDGKLICEENIPNLLFNTDFTHKLATPIRIDKNKELIVGVKVFDYDRMQLPLVYVNNESCVPGKSDLFSEDNGQTWQSLYEFYAKTKTPERGKCSWFITANITDEPQLTIAEDAKTLLGYNIYRNGEQLYTGIILPYVARFTDAQTFDNASYRIRAFYGDGELSELSDEYNVGIRSGIEQISSNEQHITIENNVLKTNLPCDCISLISIDGRKVRQNRDNVLSIEGLPKGVYIVCIEYLGVISSAKIRI